MDKEARYALAQQAESFMQSELYAYLKAEMRAAAVNLFIAAKPSDMETQKQAKYLLGVADLFDRKLASLGEQLKMDRAEEKRQKRAAKTKPL